MNKMHIFNIVFIKINIFFFILFKGIIIHSRECMKIIELASSSIIDAIDDESSPPLRHKPIGTSLLNCSFIAVLKWVLYHFDYVQCLNA